MAKFAINEGIVGLHTDEELIELNTTLTFLGYAETHGNKVGNVQYKVYCNEDTGTTYVDVEVREDEKGHYINARAKDFTRNTTDTVLDFILPIKK